MKVRLAAPAVSLPCPALSKLALLGLASLLLWNCATPPAAPPAPKPSAGPDDDHRSVGVQEFLESPFVALPRAREWGATDQGVVLVLEDGTKASLSFVAPGVVRWWVSAGEAAFSPGARYTEAPRVRVTQDDGWITLDTPVLVVRLELATLHWEVLRSGQTLVATQGAPRRSGKRLVQGIEKREFSWSGPGLGAGAARHWSQPGAFAAPALFGVGAQSSVALVLDTSYQAYTASTDQLLLGTLNGGLDLLVSVAPRPEAVVQGLTSLTGRPQLVPDWVHGTTLVLPEAQSGGFVRRAKLSIEGAWGAPTSLRPGFRALVPVWGNGGDPTLDSERRTWAASQVGSWPLGTGVGLVTDSTRSWNQSFEDQGLRSPLARMAPLLPRWEAQGLTEALRSQNPTSRPLVLTTSGGPGVVREAMPLWDVGPSSRGLEDVLNLGLAGLGTPAVRLDLTDLGRDGGAAIARLNQWLLSPVLVLDWGPDPELAWTSLTDTQRRQVKTLLDHRSRFTSYLARQSRTTAATGRPAWVPLWFDFPTDPRARMADEFLVGSLLVAPGRGSPSTKVYLPGGGVWFDFWTGEEFGGGRTYEVETRVDRPLVFARAGALVEVREPEAFDGKDVANPPTVHVFPGARGVGTYWIDDGVTEAYKAGAYHETRLLFDFDQKSMRLEHQPIHQGRIGADPYLLYRLHNLYKPRQVRQASKPIPLFGDSWGITDSDRSAAWYESDHTLLIKVFRPERDQAIEIVF